MVLNALDARGNGLEDGDRGDGDGEDEEDEDEDAGEAGVEEGDGTPDGEAKEGVDGGLLYKKRLNEGARVGSLPNSSSVNAIRAPYLCSDIHSSVREDDAATPGSYIQMP